MPTDETSIEALENIIAEVELLISTTAPLPENRTTRCLELLSPAKALTADFGSSKEHPFRRALQATAKWRHAVVNDHAEFTRRDRKLGELEDLSNDVCGVLGDRQ